jgi:hypothetical protein
MIAKPRTFSSKVLFISFICAIATVTLSVYFTGMAVHRSILQNTLLTLGILSLCFFIFLLYGLYFGFGLKSTLKDPSNKIGFVEPTSGNYSSEIVNLPEFPDLGEGLEGLLVGIVLWIVIAIFTIVLLFFLETILWASLMITVASLHWIFYRAIKLVFRNSSTTKGEILKSAKLSFYYTFVYVGWMYAVAYVLNLFK